MARFEADGVQGLIDQRLEQVSNRCAPVDEVLALVDLYRKDYTGWNMRHFHSWYLRDFDPLSDSWVRKSLQAAELVRLLRPRGVHRKRRAPSPLPGMMIHQDASTHAWIPDQSWDLVVTMDDATNEHYSMFFVEQRRHLEQLTGGRGGDPARGACSAAFTVTGGATTGTRPRRAVRSTRSTLPNLARTQAVGHRHDSPTRPRRADALSVPSRPTKDDYRRSWLRLASPPWRRPTAI